MILDFADFDGILKMSITQEKINKCIDIVKEYGGTKLILFGSALEDPQNANDLDLACEGVDGWKIYELGARLEELISTNVDLVPLSPKTRFTKYLEKQGKVIYDHRKSN